MNPPGNRLLSVLFLLLIAPGLWAADSDTLKKRKVSRTAGLSQAAYEQMQEVQALIEEDKVSQAEALLKKMQTRRLSDYELAQTWFLMGYVYFRAENYDAAQNAYEKVLSSDNLPLGMQTNVLKTLSQLSMVNEDYKDALGYIEQLLKLSEEPVAEHYALKAQVHYRLEEMDLAMASIERAEQLQAKRGEPPREAWLLLKNAILYQRNNYQGMLLVAQQLVDLYPRDRYLLNMAAIYGELGNSKKQLSLMEPLYERGSLPTASQKVNLASLYMLHDIPYKAATLLDREIKAESVDANRQHLEMLAQAWLMSANTEQAIAPLTRAAKVSDNGDNYLSLARTYMSLSRWKEAQTSVEKALGKGGLKDPGGAQLLLGMTHFNQKNYRDARRSFARAGESPRSEKLARQWLQYLEREEEKQRLADQAARSTP